MRLTLTVLLLFAMLLVVSTAKAHVTRIPARCTTKPARLLCSTHFHAHRTNHLRLAARAPRIVYQWVAERHPAARPRVLTLWVHRQSHAQRLLRRSQRLAASTSPVAIITRIFGSAASQAISVATCESQLIPTAHNASGAAGLFQLMPTWWAGRYNPYDPVVNTRLAHNLYLASGWSNWTCQP